MPRPTICSPWAAVAATPTPTPPASRCQFSPDLSVISALPSDGSRHYRVRFSVEEREQITIYLAIFRLSQAGPHRPHTGEHHHRRLVIRCEPHPRFLTRCSRLLFREVRERPDAPARVRAIIPIVRPAFDTDKNSYSSFLYLKDSKIDVGAIAIFFIDVDKALQRSSCQ